MFDSINEKLSDRSFIQSAIENKADTDKKPFGKGGKGSPFEQFRNPEEGGMGDPDGGMGDPDFEAGMGDPDGPFGEGGMSSPFEKFR